MARVTVTMADRGTATMAAMPLLITAGTPQRTTATLPPTMVLGIGVHTHTTVGLGTIAGIVTVGDRKARR
jgi:hypothetical protein